MPLPEWERRALLADVGGGGEDESGDDDLTTEDPRFGAAGDVAASFLLDMLYGKSHLMHKFCSQSCLSGVPKQLRCRVDFSKLLFRVHANNPNCAAEWMPNPRR